MDSRLRRSVLRTALRASVGASRLGVNFRSADIVRLRREFPEVCWTSFEEWANVPDWQQMLS